MDEDFLSKFDETTKKNLQSFLNGNYDEKTKKEIKQLIKTDPDEIKNRFYKKLSFGTAGIRSVMGNGINRLNKYTIRAATQGLANYLKKQNKKEIKVVIGYDNRRNSRLFAEETAKVLAANEIKALLFTSLVPTPIVSFACRYEKCNAAVMITASHNPPDYNGYKVYWEDGGQITPPHDSGIIREVEKIQDPSLIKTAELSDPFIQPLDKQILRIYLKRIKSLQTLKNENNLQIIYTSLHGTGITAVPDALKSWGFKNVFLVKEQCTVDEDFTFAKKPNPEEKEALQLGINLLNKKKADIFLATDPDADRIGVVVMHKDTSVILTGNQTACILLEHILSSLYKKNELSPKSAVVKSIVTSDLFSEIAKAYKVKCFDVLTGFKYIAEKIKEWENNLSYEFIFGAEESLGFLRETFVRDKDSISTACLISEIASKQKEKNETLIDYLHRIYKKYGVYRETVFSVNFEEGKTGMDKMKNLME